MKISTLIFIVYSLMSFTTSCSKDRDDIIYTDRAVVNFGAFIKELGPGKIRHIQSMADLPGCSGAAPVFLEVVISRDGVLQEPKRIPVRWRELKKSGNSGLVLEDAEGLVLDPGSYHLEYFRILDSKDNVLWLAPILEDWPGLEGYVEHPLPLRLELKSGSNLEVEIDVFCGTFRKPPYIPLIQNRVL